MRLFAPLAAAALFIAAPALAADAGDDAPMSTAGAVPATEGSAQTAASSAEAAQPAAAPMTTAEQIDAFLRSSPTRDTASGDALRRDRKVHGEVAAAVGSHGYRAWYVRSDIPVGETGMVSIALAQSEGGRGRGYGYGYGYGGGFSAFGPGLAIGQDPRRCGLEAMTPARSLDRCGP